MHWNYDREARTASRVLTPLERALLGVALASLGLSSCGGHDGGPREIEQTRTRSQVRERVLPGASSAQRFGDYSASSSPSSSSSSGEPELPLDWSVPEGWESLQPTEFRLIHLSPGGHPEAACYVTILEGDAGGLRANIDRWRTEQMGLAPLSDAELESLPTRPLMGVGAATYVELEGSFAGMSGAPLEGAKLVGLVLSMPAFTVFVKMTGPRDVLNAELAAFEEFCASLELRVPAGARMPDEQASGHGGHGGEGHGSAGGLGWHTPTGWRQEADRQMRLVTYSMGESGMTECYLSSARGSTLDNVNRWRGQVGEAPLDASGLASLPRMSVLGREAVLVESVGEYRGMAGGARPGTMILGLVIELPGESLFVKMVGPESEVLAAREDFLAFASSLHSDG